MTATVVYVYPVCAPQYEHYALRFLDSYHRFPPAVQHDTVVVLNGCRENAETQCLFASLPRLRFLEHDNSGYDIGAFQHAARECDTDLIVFFGASTYFNGEGWLVRMMTAMQKHGLAQYGAMGNRGDPRVKVWPHIRTTAFWMPPALFREYPRLVSRPEDRHPFEHGPTCFTSWVKSRGLKSWVVTWTRDLLWEDWDSDSQGYGRGNQSALLAGDRMCEYPYYPRRR
jgi:hypothetical protein